ncbi:unnamed protein product, partial [Arctia plantaginis]
MYYFQKWWPFFVVIFYPLPNPNTDCSSPTRGDGCYKLGMYGSSYFHHHGFYCQLFCPTISCKAGTIVWGACHLTLAGNVIVYLTILGFFTIFDMDDSDYTM